MNDGESFKNVQSKWPDGSRIPAFKPDRFVLEKLENVRVDDERVLKELGIYYDGTGRNRMLLKDLKQLIATTDDPEQRADTYMKMGQLMINQENFEAAISFYAQAFSLEPENKQNWIAINNNLGYCLNYLGRFADAEGYCRNAIKIDPECHYAYKNLGVALAGLGQVVEAARNLIMATRANATALFSMKLLDHLIEHHPEIEVEIPDLKTVGADQEKILLQLIEFYCNSGEWLKALKYLSRLMDSNDDPEKQAGYLLEMGGNMEKLTDYEVAILFYSKALSLEPVGTLLWYLINNNLGYCLNQQSRFADAEGYCRSAIQIDPERHNAYKNLGVSLAGQEQYVEAARYLIQATCMNINDPRALKLLEQLILDHPEITGEIPDIKVQIQKCQEQVQAISEARKKVNGSYLQKASDN
jgi:tetratricopeptide (TPR) repeat protein